MQSCYWFLNPELYFCLTPSLPEEVGKIFGYAEFIASLALLVIVFTIIDIRYKFRTSIAPLPIVGITFFVIVGVGFGSLITEVWIAEGWGVVEHNVFSRPLWQGFLGGIFLLSFVIWLWYAFIFPPKFSRFNSKKFIKEIYQILLKGNETELGVIADELSRSIKNIIKYSYSNDERVLLEKRKGSVSKTKGYAYDLLLLIANKRFCKVMVKSSTGTVIQLLKEVTAQKRRNIPIGDLIVNLSTEAIGSKDSLLYVESRREQSDLISYTKPLGNALFGDYALIRELGKNHCSPLDVNYFSSKDWDVESWRTYCQILLLAFDSYLEATKGGEHSPEIFRAISKIKNSLSDTYKLNGMTEDLFASPAYQKLELVVELVENLTKLLEKYNDQLHFRLRKKQVSQSHDPYDLVAELMYELVQQGSQVKAPQWTAWAIQHNVIWGKLFESFEQGNARKRLQFKLRRLIYDEIKTISNTPNYLNARVFGYCLNVMGLADKRVLYAKNYRPLHIATLNLARKNYLWLYENYKEIASQVLVGNISYDSDARALVQTFMRGLSEKSPNQILLPV